MWHSMQSIAAQPDQTPVEALRIYLDAVDAQLAALHAYADAVRAKRSYNERQRLAREWLIATHRMLNCQLPSPE